MLNNNRSNRKKDTAQRRNSSKTPVSPVNIGETNTPNQQIEKLQQNNRGLNSRIQKLETQIKTLIQNEKKYKSQINALQEETNELYSKINYLKGTVKTIQKQLENMQSELNSLTSPPPVQYPIIRKIDRHEETQSLKKFQNQLMQINSFENNQNMREDLENIKKSLHEIKESETNLQIRKKVITSILSGIVVGSLGTFIIQSMSPKKT